MKSEGLFSYVARVGAELDSLYKNNNRGRQDVIEFMDVNNWFELTYIIKEKEPFIDSEKLLKIRDRLELWLSAYKKPGHDKIVLMLDFFKNTYPETCRLYKKFISNNHLENETSSWKLLDFLLSEIDKEITEYNETCMEELIQMMNNGASWKTMELFADFLKTKKKDGQPLSKWNYSFNPCGNNKYINEAYALDDFSLMAYCVFNEDMWKKQKLIEKAVQKKDSANIWLFTAMHFICALRTSDIVRLPAPEIPFKRETVLASIQEGTFLKSDAEAIVENLKARVKFKSMKPSKSSRYENIPELKLFIPESLKAPIGIIIAIVLAHSPEINAGDPFITPVKSLPGVYNFFGENFVKAIGYKRFSSRRCNKSYLQGIDAISGMSKGKPKGYMLAALARSHKSGIGNLAKTTDIYLKDARFSGYTPEFIIKQMFERGVFSFIPAVLLEMYAGSEYTRLPVSIQTNLIGKIGLAAQNIERVTETVECALIKSKRTVNEMLNRTENIKENIFSILQNIASGNAPGRQKECLCLMTASGFRCAFSNRDSCIGCGYEIYTKTAMHMLMREYIRLSYVKDNAEPSEARRCGLILKKAVLPAVTEMIASIKILYPEADMDGLLNIMEEGLNYANCNTERNLQKLQ